MGADQFFIKTRRWYGPALVPAANLYARVMGLPMRMLPGRAWLRHERLMYRTLAGSELALCKRALLLPRLPGHTLQRILQTDPELSGEGRTACHLAASALSQVHGWQTLHPLSGRLQKFSHADATARNVLVSLECQKAVWFDFETVHVDSLSETERHADDLLTLLCSAAATSTPQNLPVLCETILCSYDCGGVQQTMLELFDSWDRRVIARPLAIPEFEDVRWRGLCQAARAVLS
jgi:hypothetical protein